MSLDWHGRAFTALNTEIWQMVVLLSYLLEKGGLQLFLRLPFSSMRALNTVLLRVPTYSLADQEGSISTNFDVPFLTVSLLKGEFSLNFSVGGNTEFRRT